MWHGRRQGGQQSGTGTEPSVAALARAAMAQAFDPLAGNNTVSALRWLERANRLVPLDPNVTLALASACLADDPARAAALFQHVLDRHDVRQAWLGLAAARLRLAGPDEAAEPLAAALSRHAFSPDIVSLAETIGCRFGSPGWCALRADGGLEIHVASPETARTTSPETARIMSPETARTMSPETARARRTREPHHPPVAARASSQRNGARGPAEVSLDGKPLRGAILPANWQRARIIDVRIGGVPLLGSPIQVGAIRRLAGCVEVRDGGLCGWAWHPGDPETAPVLTLLGPSGREDSASSHATNPSRSPTPARWRARARFG